MRRPSLVFALLLVLAFVGLAARRTWYPGRAFDRQTWLNDDQGTQGARLKMADRMVARRALLGRTRTDVVAMLGKPAASANLTDWDLVYRLGPERGFISLNDEWLVLRLDDQERIIEARIVRD